VIELVSEAEREAQVIQGEADALRNEIFATAFGADPEFFEFYRSMTAYQRALQGGNTMMVMSPESEFFNYLRSAQGAESLRSTGNGDTGAAVQNLPPVEDEAALR
jgi:membrane protease subunit HflC